MCSFNTYFTTNDCIENEFRAVLISFYDCSDHKLYHRINCGSLRLFKVRVVTYQLVTQNCVVFKSFFVK